MKSEAEEQRTVYVFQGEYRVSETRSDVFSTTLGSCVAMCLWDPLAEIGGLNHFLLPEGGAADPENLRYGLNAMELLINACLKKGADRRRLKAKLFGGAQMSDGLENIGAANARFAQSYLKAEGIECVGESLGGTKARKLRFWPATGRAQQMLVTIADSPPSARAANRRQRSANDDITFF